jgi:hypothetical protein
MNCERMQEQLPDVALGVAPLSSEVEAHLRKCRHCGDTLESLRATMKLMDEWEIPEPSPYWDTRMQARLREEKQRRPAGWLQWIRRPALGIAAALCLMAGIGIVHFERTSQVQPIAKVAPVGSAVSDLQFLDNNSNLLQNFDALDYMNGDAGWDSIN